MRNATIRVQSLDTGWETVGIDRMSGIVAENVKYSADTNGCSAASFDLKRDPAVIWPDIAAFSPITIEVDGVLVWSGRVKETPTRESASETVISVQAEGWQFHLDDDMYQRVYVHTHLSDYVDMRTAPAAVLGNASLAASGLTSNDVGAINLTMPQGATAAVGQTVGVVLDLGPNSLAKRVVVTWQAEGADANRQFFIRGSDAMDNSGAGWGAGHSDDAASPTIAVGPTTTAGTFATGRRYVQLFVFRSAGTGALGTDQWVKITSVQVFTDTLYESGNASVLKASDVLVDSLGHAPLLDDDTSSITATSFSIPDFRVADVQTPRSVQDAVNAFHNYRRLVDVRRRVIFGPQPTSAIIEAGAGAVVSVEDASANSGDDIYNKVIVTGTAGDSTPIYVERYPGGGAVSQPGGTSSSSLTITLTGTYSAHRTYLLTFFVQRVTNLSTMSGGSFQFGTATDNSTTFGPPHLTAGQGFTQSVAWTPTATYSTGVQLVVSATAGGALHNVTVSNSVLTGGGTTIPDLRGFARAKSLPLNFPTTTAAATALGDTFLAGHGKTPFKGSVIGKGSNALMRVRSGEPVPAYLMTLYAGEMLRLPDRIDPDTGAIGRDGKMASIDVDLTEDSATIALDNTRNNFEAFLARLEVVTNTRVQ